MSEPRNRWLRARVSPAEEEQAKQKIAEQFGEISVSNAIRIMLGFSQLDRAGAPKGNQNRRGKTKLKQQKSEAGES